MRGRNVMTCAALLTAVTQLAVPNLEGQAGGRGGPAAVPVPQPLSTQRIAQDLYVISGDGGNTTAYVTEEGIVLVDVKYDRNHADLLAQLKTISDKPVRYVIDTHAHGDHTGGNAAFLGSAQLIAHRNARAAMVQGNVAGPAADHVPDQLALDFAGKQIVLRYFGRAHTDGDTWVYFPPPKPSLPAMPSSTILKRVRA